MDSSRANPGGEGPVIHELQREAYVQYDRGMYAEALRLAEEIYKMDAASVCFRCGWLAD